jgi:hypothetical protein
MKVVEVKTLFRPGTSAPIAGASEGLLEFELDLNNVDVVTCHALKRAQVKIRLSRRFDASKLG